MKITGVVKSAEEITGFKGCTTFGGRDERGGFYYSQIMNNQAGNRISLGEPTDPQYDYRSEEDTWQYRKEWLKDIQEEVNWSKVPVDTKVLVNYCNDGNWVKRHFACYKDGKVYCFTNGMTSFTAEDGITSWKYAKLYEEGK